MKARVNEQKAGAREFSTKTDPPKRWWQWLLLYPGFAVAVIGAVPTYIEAVKSYNRGVSFGHSLYAEEQNRLWQKNFECARNANFSPIVNKQMVEIASVVCESGDVLLRGRRPDWEQPGHRWVSWNEVAPGDTVAKASFGLLAIIKSANASESMPLHLAQAPATSVVCQRWLAPGQLLQRVTTREGCFDEVVNTYNGRVISRRPAKCNPSC